MNHYFTSLAFDSAKLAINSFLLDSKIKYFPTDPGVERQCSWFEPDSFCF